MKILVEMRLLRAVFLTLFMSGSTFGQAYIINTAAGYGVGGFSGDGGLATSAQLFQLEGVAVDSAGNLYIADSYNNRIRKVSNGVITTVAGNGTLGFSGDGGLATSAQLHYPTSVAVDSGGNLYIADEGNLRIRKVSNGVITTVAGSGMTIGSLGDGGPATSAILYGAYGVAVDSTGNLYIADSDNHRIRKVSNGVITTVAGTGTEGFSGDLGSATSAQLSVAFGVAVDSAGNLYIADSYNNRIRKVSNGVITTVAGSGFGGQYGGGFGGDGGPATSAELAVPFGVAVDSAGNLYIGDEGNNRVRKVSNGVITTVAGNGTLGFSGDGGLATSAELAGPYSAAVDSSGNVYVADFGNNRVRILTPCTYSVAPASFQAPAAGGYLNVSIQTGAFCSWTVSALPSWITISGATSGTGSKTVVLMISPSSGTPLSATISIAGVSITITQPVAPLPSITAVVNAASFQNGPISPGEIVTLGGTGLGPSTPAGLTIQNGKVATLVGGAQVLFAGSPAPLIYVSSTQINAVVPYEIQGLLSPFAQVKYLGQTSNAFSLAPAATAPALFTANGSGTGPGAILNQDNSYNGPTNPAEKGSYVVLFLTGEGQTSPPGVTGKVTTVSATPPLTPQPLLQPTVLIGGQAATVAFYGEAPGDVSGVMQMNVQVPSNVASGNLPIQVSVGTNTSQAGVTVSVQ